MAFQFKKATKTQARLRLALIGPSGSGKTYTALTLAQHLGERVAVIDTERGSASKYADLFAFDALELDTFSPLTYVDAIKAAEAAGYDVLVIDSLSHAWMGKEGALEQVDRVAARSKSNNSYTAWRDVTPMHTALIDAMLQTRCHLIVTMRAKTEYVLEANSKGKMEPRKVGMAPIQRDGMEYEFDVVGDMDFDNTLIVTKSRCSALTGAVIGKPGKELADALKAWLTDGAPVVVPPSAPQPNKTAPTTGNGSKPAAARPFTPEQLRANFAKAVVTIEEKGFTLGPDDYKITEAATKNLLKEPHLEKYLDYVTGVPYLDDFNEAQVIALLRLLKPTVVDGQWIPAEEAVTEALSVAKLIGEHPELLDAQPA
jgi:hypothetical protein